MASVPMEPCCAVRARSLEAADRVRSDGERGRVYRAMALLLQHGSDDRGEGLGDAAAILRGSPPTRAGRELEEALELSRANRRGFDPDQLIGRASRRCLTPLAPVRAWACVSAELAPSQDRLVDLYVLAALSERASSAVALGRIELATAVSDMRRELIREHAWVCLSGLARELLATRGAFATRLGRALVFQLEDELAIEESPAAPALEPPVDSGPGPRATAPGRVGKERAA